MILNHLDLPVSDIAAAWRFFEFHFGFRCVHTVPERLAILSDDADFRLALSALPPGAHGTYPPGFHIGFVLEDEAAVRALHDQLAAGGVAIRRPLGPLAGALTFHCDGPDGLLVEIACRPQRPTPA